MCIYKLGCSGFVQQLAERRQRRPAAHGPNPVDLALEVDGVPGMLRARGRPVNVSCALDPVQRLQRVVGGGRASPSPLNT